MSKPWHAFCLVSLTIAGLTSSLLFGQGTASTGSIVIADGSSNPASVPAWLSWKVFYESLNFHLSRSPDQTRSMLASKFNLSAQEINFLLGRGHALLNEIQRIDSEARAHVQANYGVNRRPPANIKRPGFRPTDVNPATSGRPIQIPPGARSLRDALKRSGYLDQVENRKAVAALNHSSSLQSGINSPGLARIRNWVLTDLAKQIKVVEQGVKVNGLDRGPSRNGFFSTR